MEPWRLGILLCLGLMGGCSVAPVDVAMGVYQPASPRSWSAGPSAAPSPAATCGFHLQPVADKRADKADMGMAGRRPVHGGDMAAWVTSAIASLQSQGFRVDTDAKPDDRFAMQVDLLKAYMQDTGTSITAGIVVQVGYARMDGSALAGQLYRGDDASVDWASSDREIDRDFRLATEDLLQHLVPDLGRHCLETQPAGAAAAQR